ncbi:hypothetical protein EDB85DRAFT_2273581 [Lactarius pseudohatsudake]|nr:hypothetical protein EDB85DRAFT_2273581 [Lactarius pseudohatsudake]
MRLPSPTFLSFPHVRSPPLCPLPPFARNGGAGQVHPPFRLRPRSRQTGDLNTTPTPADSRAGLRKKKGHAPRSRAMGDTRDKPPQPPLPFALVIESPVRSGFLAQFGKTGTGTDPSSSSSSRRRGRCERVAVIARLSSRVVVVVVVDVSMLRLLMRVVLAAVGVSFLRLSLLMCVVLAAVGVLRLSMCRSCGVDVSSSWSSWSWWWWLIYCCCGRRGGAWVVVDVVVVRVGVGTIVVVETGSVRVGIGAAVGPVLVGVVVDTGVVVAVKTGWDRSQPALWRFTQIPDLDEPQPVRFSNRMNRNRRSGCHRLQSGPVPVFFRFIGLDFRTLVCAQGKSRNKVRHGTGHATRDGVGEGTRRATRMAREWGGGTLQPGAVPPSPRVGARGQRMNRNTQKRRPSPGTPSLQVTTQKRPPSPRYASPEAPRMQSRGARAGGARPGGVRIGRRTPVPRLPLHTGATCIHAPPLCAKRKRGLPAGDKTPRLHSHRNGEPHRKGAREPGVAPPLTPAQERRANGRGRIGRGCAQRVCTHERGVGCAPLSRRPLRGTEGQGVRTQTAACGGLYRVERTPLL